MPISVLHIAHYAAAYRGNFIESLEKLEQLISTDGGKTVYMFPEWAATDKSCKWISEMEEQGKKIYFFGYKAFDNAKKIRSIIENEKVDIIHTHFLPAEFQIGVKIACQGKKIKQVTHFHNHSEHKKGIKAVLRRVFYQNNILVSCSWSVYKSVCRDYPRNKKFEIDNGIETKRLEKYEILRPSDLGLKEGIPICLIFGFDFERKGVDLACKAIYELRKKGKNVQLLVSLSSNFETVEMRIKELLGEMPEWLKIIPSRNDVASLYNSVQVFLSPSREEGLPYSVLEASYCKCGVVLSDIEAQKFNLQYTTWFNNGDANALADAIIKEIAIQREKIQHLDEVKQKITECYSVLSWAKGMMEIYNQMGGSANGKI